eukprot:13427757-Heterocapsa_arctica.AAC.2
MIIRHPSPASDPLSFQQFARSTASTAVEDTVDAHSPGDPVRVDQPRPLRFGAQATNCPRVHCLHHVRHARMALVAVIVLHVDLLVVLQVVDHSFATTLGFSVAPLPR